MIQQRHILRLALLLLACVTCSLAQVSEKGLYLGGITRVIVHENYEYKGDGAMSLAMGYDLNDYFALEVKYALIPSYSIDFEENITSRTKDVSIIANLPLYMNEEFTYFKIPLSVEAFAGVGVSAWEIQFYPGLFSGMYIQDDSGISPIYRLGIKSKFSNMISFALEYATMNMSADFRPPQNIRWQSLGFGFYVYI